MYKAKANAIEITDAAGDSYRVCAMTQEEYELWLDGLRVRTTFLSAVCSFLVNNHRHNDCLSFSSL